MSGNGTTPMLVRDFLERSAERLPEKTALVCGKNRYSYAAVEEAANGLSAALAELGLRRGERVVIFLDSSFESVVSIFAVLKASGVFVVLNPTMRAPKLAHILRDCGARILVSDARKTRVWSRTLQMGVSLEHVILAEAGTEDLPPHRRPGLDVHSWEELLEGPRKSPPRGGSISLDLAALIYTSGSTGEPKGVMSAHYNIVSAVRSIVTYLENVEDDIVMDVLPLSFDYGLYQVLMAFYFGGTVVLEKSFAYPFRIVERLVEERVTGFPIVPSIAAILLRMEHLDRYDLSSLRYITNTAAALPEVHIKRLIELFPGVRIYSMYGLTECKRVSYLPPSELPVRPTSVGIPMPDTEVAVVDEGGNEVPPGVVGELTVRGLNVMQGYWNSPEETERVFRKGRYPGERILYTGDLFRRDEDGFLYFVGRKDDMIKTMGERVSPKEVENTLCAMEGVSEAAVVGLPDEVAGQVIKAFVVPSGGRPSVREILKHCRENLEPFMVPKFVEFRENLPKNPSGKIDKARLLSRDEGACSREIDGRDEEE